MQELIQRFDNRVTELKKKVSGMMEERNKMEAILKRMNNDIERSIGAVEELELQKRMLQDETKGEKGK